MYNGYSKKENIMEQDKDLTLQQIAESALADSVVRLDVEREIPLLALRPEYKLSKINSSSGSGFFIEKHLIVTNCHVIIGTKLVSIRLSGSVYVFGIESVISYDIENDLVILKVVYEGKPLILGDSDKIREGDGICAIGYPSGEAKVIHGTVDSILGSRNRIRTLIDTSSGSSGSPIMNSKGAIIGIASSSDSSYGYIVPSNLLKQLISDSGQALPIEEWQNLPPIRAISETGFGDDMMKNGDYKKAIAHYDSAIELNPKMLKAYEGRADAKNELWAFGRAIEDLIAVRRLDPVSFSFSNIWKFVSWKREGVWIWGSYLLILFLRTLFGKYGWLRFKGHAKIGAAKSEAKKGDKAKVKMIYQESISDFTEAITLKPKVAGTYNSRGWTKYLLGQLETEEENEMKAQELYQEAISDADLALQSATKESNNKAACYHTRGAAKAGLGDHEGAITDFNECIRLRPKKALYYHDCGLSKQALGQHEAAEVDFAKTKELDPKFKNKSN